MSEDQTEGAREEPNTVMLKLRYKASADQFAPRELLMAVSMSYKQNAINFGGKSDGQATCADLRPLTGSNDPEQSSSVIFTNVRFVQKPSFDSKTSGLRFSLRGFL